MFDAPKWHWVFCSWCEVPVQSCSKLTCGFGGHLGSFLDWEWVKSFWISIWNEAQKATEATGQLAAALNRNLSSWTKDPMSFWCLKHINLRALMQNIFIVSELKDELEECLCPFLKDVLSGVVVSNAACQTEGRRFVSWLVLFSAILLFPRLKF